MFHGYIENAAELLELKKLGIFLQIDESVCAFGHVGLIYINGAQAV